MSLIPILTFRVFFFTLSSFMFGVIVLYHPLFLILAVIPGSFPFSSQ